MYNLSVKKTFWALTTLFFFKYVALDSRCSLTYSHRFMAVSTSWPGKLLPVREPITIVKVQRCKKKKGGQSTTVIDTHLRVGTRFENSGLSSIPLFSHWTSTGVSFPLSVRLAIGRFTLLAQRKLTRIPCEKKKTKRKWLPARFFWEKNNLS